MGDLKQVAVRASDLARMQTQEWDLVVIGGGITGAGVAQQAARRGWSVLLIEQRDFDRPSALANPLAKFGCRDLQGIGADLRRAVERLELLRRYESHDAQPALIPE